MSLIPYLLAALLAGALAIERKAFLQAAASRPLIAGSLMGLVLGQPEAGLSLGAALELFFLGSVNLGASLPDNDLFTTVAATACACALAGLTALPLEASLCASVLASLAAAKLGMAADRFAERVNAWGAARAERQGEVRSRLRYNLAGLWFPFFATALIALAGALAGAALGLPLRHGPSSVIRALSVAWAAFLVVAAAAGLRSLHTTRALTYGMVSALVAVGGQVIRSLSM